MTDTPMGAADESSEGEDRAVYVISVAAELAGVHPQTLRIYERKGLLRPARTAGNTRRYSERDIERLRMIQQLTQEAGLNLAGVKMIVELQNELEVMRLRLAELALELDRAHERMREEMERARGHRPQAAIVPADSVRVLGLGRRRAVPSGDDRPPGGPIAMGPARP
jgi:MerR family transcriptional regulator/heat shock protein HspR